MLLLQTTTDASLFSRSIAFWIILGWHHLQLILMPKIVQANLRISIGGPPEKPFICSMQEKLPNFSANCSRNLAHQANKQRESNQPEYHSYSTKQNQKRKTLQSINQKNQVFKYNPKVQDCPTRSIVSILVASFASDHSKHRLISFTFLPRDSTHPLQQNHRGSEGSKTSLSKTKSPAKRPGTFSRWSWKVWSEGTWQSNMLWTNWCFKLMFVKRTCSGSGGGPKVYQHRANSAYWKSLSVSVSLFSCFFGTGISFHSSSAYHLHWQRV